MTRSLYRKILFRYNIFYFLKNGLKFGNRNLLIVPSIKKISFLIYNGKNFVNLLIRDNIIGYLVGNFITTRKLCVHKKKKN
uniref:Ribosomal protein S19 n=1 Tax=Cyanidium caldarium TaxID=2771 RepID=A0A7H0WBD1_CYACA|nr:ribosomal protein S19 [Cyanidium caldarium]QNR39860.1 ribosomal protein S19 [Cyanidium caldarium]